MDALMLPLLLACGLNPSTTRTPPGSEDTSVTDTHDSAVDTDTQDSAVDTGTGICPQGMAWIDPFCIDRWEAILLDHSPYEVPESGVAATSSGQVPQGYISGTVGASACEAAGKRLCTLDEWMRACQGPEDQTYPYGNVYDPDACNTSRATHPIVDYWGSNPLAWDPDHMNDAGINQQEDTVDAGGANPDCVSAEGVYDLHGNLHEWISSPEGVFKGGFYADASINGEGCSYATTAHSFGYHDYSTGFRCCSDP